ncbi:MAG: LysR family transcriptional regulator [Solirubrobacterales bacterium]|nr:LysR family transcriptional regulator [Solirubrobacterales bacterium]
MAEERHFTQAARRLGVAQSTVSSSVRALEREFDAALLTRSTRRVELTDVGRALLPDARRALAAAEVARASVDAVTGLRAGRVAMGTGKALQIDVAERLTRFCAEHPGIDVSLRQGGSLELLEAVGAGELDFAPLGLVGSLPEHIQDAVLVAEVHREPMVLACAPGHPLAARKSVRLLDTADERFADFSADWAIRIVNDRLFTENGRRRRVAYEMNDVDDLLDIVRHGLAVAVVPRSVTQRSEHVRFLSLRGPAPTWSVGVAVPRGRLPSPAARALFEALLPDVAWPA